MRMKKPDEIHVHQDVVQANPARFSWTRTVTLTGDLVESDGGFPYLKDALADIYQTQSGDFFVRVDDSISYNKES